MSRPLTFAHLSDPHLTTLKGVKAADLFNKRILGYLTWRFSRRYEHLPGILDALAADLARTRPDHVVVTGDLTHLGLPGEFRQAARWLQSLGSAHDITVIPGNHDAYVQTPWDKTYAAWWPYMGAGQAFDASAPPGDDPRSLFPTLQLRGQVAFIGLSSATPSAPFYAVGSLGAAQLQRLDKMLSDTGEHGYCRVVLIHHPPLPGSVRHSKRLVDGEALQSLLMRRGAELVLHGHTHHACRETLATPRGVIPIMGVPSASAIGHKPGHRAQYHLYRVTPTADGWDLNVSVRGYSTAEERFIDEGVIPLAVTRTGRTAAGVSAT
jgi:3',5'-cyclic AMP phosphodiesterase CpdA